MILVTYNGRPYLDDCLQSVGDELRPGDEVVVVDNASADGSADLVEEHFPLARLVRNGENRGFAAACNQGGRLASAEVLVFLNQDTRVAPGWLQALLASLDGEGSPALVTSQALLMSRPDRIHLCGQDVHYTGLASGRGTLQPAGSLAGVAEVAAVSGASFAVRREVWQELGGFDETFYMYYEETDLSWRAQLAGHRCLYAPDSVVYHDYRPAQPSPARAYYSFRNRYLMLLKNWRWRTLLLLLPGLVLAELVDWRLALDQGRRGLAAKARANLWLLGHLLTIARLHDGAQAGRATADGKILARRSRRLAPQETEVGTISRALLAACNVLFRLNYRLALGLCRWAGW